MLMCFCFGGKFYCLEFEFFCVCFAFIIIFSEKFMSYSLILVYKYIGLILIGEKLK